MSIDMLPRAVSSEFHETSEFVAPIWGGDGEVVSIETLRKRFLAHEMSEHFANQTPRYVKRFPIREERAVEYLGNDACPVMHQFELADRHLLAFLDDEYRAGTLLYPHDPTDRSLLYFVCSFHDFGEPEHSSIVEAGFTPVGDIPAGTKTPQNRLDEMRVRKFTFGTHFGDIDPAFLARAEAIIAHTPFAGDELLHDIFELIHDSQTLETASIATQSAEKVDTPEEDAVILRTLGRTASSTVIPHLENTTCFASSSRILSLRPKPLQYAHVVDESNKHLHAKCCSITA